MPLSFGVDTSAAVEVGQGADKFFGEPALDLNDLIQTQSGKGVINILAADKLMQKAPKVYATFLLWMLSELFENLPEMHAMALGFYEETRNGHRIIGHGGDTQWFHSDLQLFPDDGIGFFVSTNSAGKDGAARDIRSALFDGFTKRYLPGPGPVLVDIPKDVTQAKAEYSYPKTISLRSYNPVKKGHGGQIRKAAQLLLGAKRPYIYTGGGVVLGAHARRRCRSNQSSAAMQASAGQRSNAAPSWLAALASRRTR